MRYQFPPDLDERVKERMMRLGLPSEDDVLRQAMDALDQLEQENLHRWNERNQISIEQSQRGLSKPLDLDSILGRVGKGIKRDADQFIQIDPRPL
jgi:Arc/MetJ-type ribon-helix-helix transcriptional regulator